MANTVVNFYPRKQNPRRVGGRYINRILLKPGKNVLNEAQTTKIQSAAEWKEGLAKGFIVILSETLSENTIVNLKEFTIAKAIELIKETNSLEQLNNWLEVEENSKKRDKVLKALAKQITDIEEGNIV